MQRLSWEPESFELHLTQAGQLEAQPSVYSHLSHSLLDPPDFASLRLPWAPASFYRMSMQRLGSIFYSVGRMSQTGQLNSQSELACGTALGVWSYKRYPLGRSELGLLLLYDPLRHSSLPTWRGKKGLQEHKDLCKAKQTKLPGHRLLEETGGHFLPVSVSRKPFPPFLLAKLGNSDPGTHIS